MKKRKINIAKITWIMALFLELVIILIMVMDYKIHYQYQTINKIYFYECSGTLCVTEVKDDDHLMYSSYECGYEDCPTYKKELGDTYVILTEEKNSILFDYRKGEVISNKYDDYQPLNNNYFIVTKNNLQGIINMEDKLTVSLNYDQLGYKKDSNLIGYTLNSIIAKTDDKYGIISLKDGTLIEEFKYSEEEIETLLKKLNTENTSIETT